MNGITAKSQLTPAESTRLSELEPIIERGLTNFVEVGNALLEISDKRLYRATHTTFKAYVEDKWKLSVRRAYQLCEAAEVIKALPEHCAQLCTNEGQARDPAKVEPEKLAQVLETVTSNGPVTAKAIREAAGADDDDRPCVVAHTEVMRKPLTEIEDLHSALVRDVRKQVRLAAKIGEILTGTPPDEIDWKSLPFSKCEAQQYINIAAKLESFLTWASSDPVAALSALFAKSSSEQATKPSKAHAVEIKTAMRHKLADAIAAAPAMTSEHWRSIANFKKNPHILADNPYVPEAEKITVEAEGMVYTVWNTREHLEFIRDQVEMIRGGAKSVAHLPSFQAWLNKRERKAMEETK